MNELFPKTEFVGDKGSASHIFSFRLQRAILSTIMIIPCVIQVSKHDIAHATLAIPSFVKL